MRRGLTALLLVSASLGCEGWPPDPPPPPVVILGLALDATDMTIQQGEQRQLTATVKRVGEVGVALELRAEGVPAGIVVSIGTPTTVGDITTAPVTIDVTPNAALGLQSVTLRALGQPLKRAKVSPSMAVLTVRVTERSRVALALSRPAVTMIRGGMTRLTARLDRTNFDAPVALSFQGPPGVTAEFSDNPSAGDSVVVTLHAGLGAAAGSAQGALTAAAAGVPEAVAPLTLAVTNDQVQLLPPEVLVVGQGSGAAAEVQVLRAGFTGGVTLAAEAAPGISITFDPAVATGVAAALTLMVDGSVATGVYPVVLHGTPDGGSPVTATFDLAVLASSVNAASDPGGVSLLHGTNATVRLLLARTLYNEAVTLSVENLPPGLTVSISPTVITDTAALVTVTAAGAAAGDYELHLRVQPLGPAPGSTGAAVLAVVVREPEITGNITLDWSSCTAPKWVAARDGDGPWVQVLPQGGVARFSMHETRGSYAYVTQEQRLVVEYMTREEATAGPRTMCPPPPEPTRTVHGSSYQSAPVNTPVRHFLGGRMATTTAAQPSFTMQQVPLGPVDQLSAGGATGSNRILIRRDLNPPDGGSLEMVNIADMEASPVVGSTFTINGTGAPSGNGTLRTTTDYLMGEACYRTAEPLFSNQQGVSGTGTFTRFINILGVPPAQQRAGDFHLVTVMFGAAGVEHSAAVVLAAHQPRTVVLVATEVPQVSPVVTTERRLRAMLGTIPATYNGTRSFTYTDQQRTVVLRASAEFTGLEPVELAVPDLRGISGWSPSFGIPAHEGGTWQVRLEGANGPNLCADGRLLHTARYSGTF